MQFNFPFSTSSRFTLKQSNHDAFGNSMKIIENRITYKIVPVQIDKCPATSALKSRHTSSSSPNTYIYIFERVASGYSPKSPLVHFHALERCILAFSLRRRTYSLSSARARFFFPLAFSWPRHREKCPRAVAIPALALILPSRDFFFAARPLVHF